MASFNYIARNQLGEEVKGVQSAQCLDEAVDGLHEKGLTVLHLVDTGGESPVSTIRRHATQLSLWRVGTRDLALFNRQLATVLESGIPLVKGLRGLAADSSNKTLGRAVDDIAARIERGENLSDAMAAHPEAFNDMYLSMIRAGERAGTLDQIVEQLAIYLEKIDAIKTKVRSALSYPVFTLIFAVVVVLFLLLKIVPTFAEIYDDLGQQLPTFTRLIVSVSELIRSHVVMSVAIVIGFVVTMGLIARTPRGRYAIDKFAMSVPVFGSIVTKAVMSRFARTFSILLRSGLPLLEGLALVRGAAGNAVVAGAIDEVREKVEAGHGITDSFRATGKFPEMVLQLMGTGEEAGEMDTMLMKTSDFYDRQVEASVHGLSSLIEPLMIVVIGALIGIIVVSMFLPIFYLGDAIMRGGYNF